MFKIVDEFWRIAKPEEDDEEFEEIEAPSTRAGDRERRASRSSVERESQSDFPSYSSGSSSSSSRQAKWESSRGKGRENIVKITRDTTTKIHIMQPKEFAEAKDIAGYLKSRCTVFLNLEQTDEDVKKRILDFLAGVAYALDGTMKRAAKSTFVFAPTNVDFLDDDIDNLVDDLEESGFFGTNDKNFMK